MFSPDTAVLMRLPILTMTLNSYNTIIDLPGVVKVQFDDPQLQDLCSGKLTVSNMQENLLCLICTEICIRFCVS